MHARVSTLQGSTDRIDEGTETIRDSILPALKQIAGYKGFLSLVDRQSGKGLVVALWESEEAMRASEEEVKRLRGTAAESVGATGEPTVERYEVTLYEVEAPISV